jgi:hypothetical protein
MLQSAVCLLHLGPPATGGAISQVTTYQPSPRTHGAEVEGILVRRGNLHSSYRESNNTKNTNFNNKNDHAVGKHHRTIDGHSHTAASNLRRSRRQTKQKWPVETYRNRNISQSELHD